jgi:hypothetical protein
MREAEWFIDFVDFTCIFWSRFAIAFVGKSHLFCLPKDYGSFIPWNP